MARQLLALLLAFTFSSSLLTAAEWTGWRGPNGDARATDASLPTEWAAGKNVVWKTKTPGPGTACPLVVGDRVYVTCYTGYGLAAGQGDQKQLKRHLVCLDRKSGAVLWTKAFQPKLPEHRYAGEGAYHGYAASTPATDGKHLYLFLGKSGVFCLDLDGKQVWHADVGGGINRWGSGTSPVLHKGLVIVNASVESGSMVALDQKTGRQAWKTGGISSSWNTPIIAAVAGGGSELVVSIQGRVLGLDPGTGQKLWNADGVHRYVCPSVVAHKGVAYIIGGGHTSLAVKIGGRVTSPSPTGSGGSRRDQTSPRRFITRGTFTGPTTATGPCSARMRRPARLSTRNGSSRDPVASGPRQSWATARSTTRLSTTARSWWRPVRSSNCWPTTCLPTTRPAPTRRRSRREASC